jgi:hypothetical protein
MKVEVLSETALLAGDVPADCQLLIVAGPTTHLAPQELERIEKYLDQGGRLMVLFNRNSLEQPTGLERLLGRWGLEVGNNWVCEAPESTAGDRQQLVVSAFGPHPITQSLLRSRLMLILPRSVEQREGASQSADAPQVAELATTGPEGAAVRLSGRIERKNAAIPVIVAVEKGAIQGIAADRGATRIVAAGDSFFLGNAPIRFEANIDFARSAVHWLVNRDALLEGIGPRPVKEYRINLTNAQLGTLRWIFLVGFPGSFLVLGFLVWLRRRA